MTSRRVLAAAATLAAGTATVLAMRQDADLGRRATDRLAALQREAESLATQERTILVELRRLELDRQIKTEQLAKLQRDAGDVQAQLAEAEDRAATLARQAETERPDVE